MREQRELVFARGAAGSVEPAPFGGSERTATALDQEIIETLTLISCTLGIGMALSACGTDLE